jgi:hypothetical protein
VHRLLTYWATANLGDALQTIALSRFLPPALGIPRCRLPEQLHAEKLFVVNGWHRWPREVPASDANCLFAGIHCADAHVPWLRQSRFPLGARDPFTHALLQRHGLDSVLLGCATLTFPRYDGPRDGALSVDFPGGPGVPLTHGLKRAAPFAAQWQLGLRALDRYRRAAEVHTSRLHVALPCLAFGTPVAFHPAKFQPERYGLLELLGVKFGELQTLDVTPQRERFIAFLRAHLGEITEGEPKLPAEPPGGPPNSLEPRANPVIVPP